MQAKLVVVEPAADPSEYEVELPLTIGRGEEAALKLPFALISREHCELFEDRGRIMVRDLGSLNGTFVGGKRVELAPLPSGELLTIGSVTLRAVYGDGVWPANSAISTRKGAAETITIDDTQQATQRPPEEIIEPLEWDEDGSRRLYKPSDN